MSHTVININNISINRVGFVCAVFVASCFFSVFTMASATVDSLRVWRAPDNTRVVFDMSNTVDYQLFALTNPHRLVVDISDTKNKASLDLSSLDIKDSPVKGIRSAVRNNKDLRLVFDLAADVKPRSFLLKPNKGKPHRLVIDLYDNNIATEKTLANVSNEAVSTTSTSTGSTVRKRVPRDIIIVVDAGHGGEDPGAIGPKGIQEKQVVLDIAKKLAALINNKKGYKAVLTRDGDYFIPLRQRRDKARELRADLFVSVHADAFNVPQANGASVYALSRSGATSEAARFLAKQENDADLIGGVGDVSLDDKDEVLRGVLVDLSMTATVGSSLEVGKEVLNDMQGIARLHKKQVEQAGFLVLKSPDVPSILIETGFISNPKEAKLLASSSYRQKMATSIFKGIERHFYSKPPASTYIAWQKDGGKESDLIIPPLELPASPVVTKPVVATVDAPNVVSNSLPATHENITHKVVNGDSLSMIAQRYRVSMAKLKQLNNLKSYSIRVGQVLVISEKNIEVASSAIVHKVKSGETLSEIAQAYRISSATLKDRNNLTSSTIKVGQVLTISP